MNTDMLTNYSTGHVPLAAYLSVLQCQIKYIDVINGKGIFYFEHVPREYVHAFNNGTGQVEPGAFAAKMNQLIQSAKRQLFDGVQ